MTAPDPESGSWGSAESAGFALLPWIRHYRLLIVVFMLLGATAGLLAARATAHTVEAWTLLVQTEGDLSARQLPAVAEAVFRSSAQFRALAEAGLGDEAVDPERTPIDLRPVPETPLLIVVGRSQDPDQAKKLSASGARALLQELARAGFPNFEILGRPRRSALSPTVPEPVAVVMGAVIGLLVGVSVGLVAFWARRPVLFLPRALALLSPDQVSVVNGAGRWRLSRRHSRLPWADVPRHRRAVRAVFRGMDGIAVDIVSPGTSSQTEARIREQLDRGYASKVRSDTTVARGQGLVVLADRRTREMDLRVVPLSLPPSPGPGVPRRLALLWIE